MKTPAAITVLLPAVLAGCVGMPGAIERDARNAVGQVGSRFVEPTGGPDLSGLRADASLTNLVHFALLNQPRVRAAYFDWAAAVERITVERSLPDPQLTFESDIADIVMTVMPGFMQMLPGPGKLKAAARVAAAESQIKYHAYESAVLQTAFEVKRAYHQLRSLDEQIRINRQNLDLLRDLERIARARNEVGKATLQDIYRAQIEQDRLTTELVNLEDSRQPLLAQFKGALGLTPDQPDPPIPVGFESTPAGLTAEDLLATAFAHNPRLKQMEAEVRMAEAKIALAAKSRVPDFSLGLMADVKASPAMLRPLAGMTLPIWHDKIAAEIAAAQAGKSAAQARLSAGQIQLAVEFADRSFMYREATRNLTLLTDTLLFKARRSLEVAQAGYSAGKTDLLDLLDAQRTLLELQLAEVEARTRRELALAELSLLVAGVPPASASVLTAPGQPFPTAAPLSGMQ